MSQSTKASPKHLASSKQFLVINQDNETKQDDAENGSASSGKSSSGDTPRAGTNSLPSRPIGHKRNFFLDARDVYSAYQPNQVIGMSSMFKLLTPNKYSTVFVSLFWATSLTILGLFSLQARISSEPTCTRKWKLLFYVRRRFKMLWQCMQPRIRLSIPRG